MYPEILRAKIVAQFGEMALQIIEQQAHIEELRETLNQSARHNAPTQSGEHDAAR